jgi:hypothetical protein
MISLLFDALPKCDLRWLAPSKLSIFSLLLLRFLLVKEKAGELPASFPGLADRLLLDPTLDNDDLLLRDAMDNPERVEIKDEADDEAEVAGDAKARYSWDVSSVNDLTGGKGGGSWCEDMAEDGSGELEGDVSDLAILVCAKCGIVEISGDRAHGFVEEVRSWSNVGSIILKIVG